MELGLNRVGLVTIAFPSQNKSSIPNSTKISVLNITAANKYFLSLSLFSFLFRINKITTSRINHRTTQEHKNQLKSHPRQRHQNLLRCRGPQINYPSLKQIKQDSIEQARGRSHEDDLVQILCYMLCNWGEGLEVV